MKPLRTRLAQWACLLAVAPSLSLVAMPTTAVASPPPAAAAATYARASAAAPEAEALQATLKQAIEDTNEDPEANAPALRRALEDVAAVPGVTARTVGLQELRIEGLLILARALLVLDSPDEAAEALDEAIRVSGGSVSGVGDYGPSLSKLYEERRSDPQLRPAGSIHVTCSGPCRFILDGRVIGNGTDVVATGIPLGAHVVRLEPETSAAPDVFEQHDVILRDTAPEQDFSYDPPAPAKPTTGEAAAQPATGDSGRKLPRWAGILGMTLGGVAMLGGAFAIAIDGRCPDLSDASPKEGQQQCRDVHTSLGTGIGVLAVGVGSITGFGVAFGLGEAKDKRFRREQAGQSAVLQMRWRF